jgi:hypothetical protein
LSSISKGKSPGNSSWKNYTKVTENLMTVNIKSKCVDIKYSYVNFIKSYT